MSKGILRIDRNFLSKIHQEESLTPNMYFFNNPMFRWFFWERLNVIVNYINSNYSMKKARCEDFEGCSSTFLMSLLLLENCLIKTGPSCSENSGTLPLPKPLDLFSLKKSRLLV
jgi:hypothetical protein